MPREVKTTSNLEVRLPSRHTYFLIAALAVGLVIVGLYAVVRLTH